MTETNHQAPVRILLIEDDLAFQAMLMEALEDRGYTVEAVSDAESGIAAVERASYDLILSDVKLPGMTGIEAVPKLKQSAPNTDIIIMTAYSDKETALDAVKLGAYDFFSKPFSLAEMEVVIRRALEKRRLQQEVGVLKQTLKHSGPTKKIIGRGPAMQRIITLVERIAPLESTVLITGESGTGKELISDVIHELSPRAGGPFVKVNCAAIPENLLESELFGHEKGAFTGAVNSRPGKFESAHTGTIMLDEIGDMPLSIQPKLLRVVEQKQLERLGGRKTVDIDVRIIAVTNQDLAERIEEKAFRQDLYYRLNVASIHLPPLRERKEDIPLLADTFLDKINAKLGTHYTGFSDDAVDALFSYDWPGNVRQLANAVERASIIGLEPLLTGADVTTAFQRDMQPAAKPAPQQRTSLSETLREVEKNLILNALKRSGGKQVEAAKILGIGPKNLWNKLKKHDIDPAQFQATN